MAHRIKGRWAKAACMGLAAIAVANGYAQASPPPPLAAVANSANQQLAETIAQRMSAATQITGYQVEVSCEGSTVELTGSVKDAQQASQIINIVRGVRGVSKIVNRMTPGTIKPVQNVEGLPVPSQMPAGAVPAGPQEMPQGMPQGMPTEGYGGPQGCTNGGGNGGVVYDGGSGGGYGGGYSGGDGSFGPVYGGDPTPTGMPATGGLYDSAPPKMPPYAWPTYAPHNNYSRVAYPQQYPANAFPFIGPFYPFPKVPPGYRAIKLEWEDGAWYYGRTATKRNWWSIRYW